MSEPNAPASTGQRQLVVTRSAALIQTGKRAFNYSGSPETLKADAEQEQGAGKPNPADAVADSQQVGEAQAGEAQAGADATPRHPYEFGELAELSDDDYVNVHEWGALFQHYEVSKPVAEAVVSYYLGDLRREAAQGMPKIAHHYDTRDFGFRDADMPNLHRVLNKLATVGATQSEVNAILQNYVAAVQQDEKRAARNVKRGDWGRQQPAKNETVEAEIAKIENTMRTNRQAYNRDEGSQKRLRELYAQRAQGVT